VASAAGEDAVAMASNYTALTSETTTEISPANTLIDVLSVTAQAIPSGIVFHARFPPAINDPQSVAGILSAWADEMNDINSQPGVTGVTWIQDFDANDQLVDRLAITVASDNGQMTQTVDNISLYDYPQPMKDQIAAVHAFLNSLQGL
jgi:hypothetical protein